MKKKYFILILGMVVISLFLASTVIGATVRTLPTKTVTTKIITPTCTDSDGLNFDKKGFTTGKKNNKDYKLEDICVKDIPNVKKPADKKYQLIYNFAVVEQYCAGSESELRVKLCPKGYACESGACKSVLLEKLFELKSKKSKATTKKFK